MFWGPTLRWNIFNLSLSQLYTDIRATKSEVYNAFRQRIKNIIRFTAFKVWHYELKDGEPVKPPKTIPPKQIAILEPIEDDGTLPF